MKPDVVTIDFETDAIEDRPKYPPKPCGVSIKYRGKAPRYFAWGHATKNNATKAQARDAVRDAYRSGKPLLFHNAKFDADVAEVHFGLKVPQWDRIHDLLYLLFLNNPHARSLSLKPSAHELLGMKPTEKDAVFEWLVKQGVLNPKQQKRASEHYPKVPGDLLGTYANGDTNRTERLFDHLLPKILSAEMGRAYDRERRLMPILLRNEREGMRVDVNALERDVKKYAKAQRDADAWLRKRLKAPTLNVDSDADLAEALDRSGVVTRWVRTPTGKRSTAKDNMTVDIFDDKRVFIVLGYRNRLGTCLSTFMRPWLEMATASGGLIFTHWNQVRQSHGDESTGGTRTGRLSCSPNFQNIPKNWFDKNDGFTLELFKFVLKLGLPPLPMIRRYVLPDKGEVFCHRDYSQQEPRILAHFEDDKLCAQYNTDPTTDVHEYVRQQILALTGIELERRPTKVLNLAIMYGMGLGALAADLGVDVVTAKKLKAAHTKAMPGVAVLDREIKQRGRSGQPIRTWGGRVYYVEPPKLINGFLRTFEYKLLNYLIQGSASDCTKEALIRYDEHPKKRGRFLVTVHDENNASAAKRAHRQELLVMREAMESVEFDVRMTTDAKAGPHWGALTKVVEKRAA